MNFAKGIESIRDDLSKENFFVRAEDVYKRGQDMYEQVKRHDNILMIKSKS